MRPQSILRKLLPNEGQPFLTHGGTSAGWPKLAAFHPVETFHLRHGSGLDDFYEFVERQRGNFIAGYIGYDLGYELHGVKKTAPDIFAVPPIQLASYEGYCRFEKESTEVRSSNAKYRSVVENILKREEIVESTLPSCRLTARLKMEDYRRNFEKIVRYIKAGDLYQINYTHLMQGKTDSSGRALFAHLLRNNPVDFAAYWEQPEFTIISLSPESFVSIEDRKIVTCPIKGTRPRGRNPAEDREMMRQLLYSKKEQAELYMITDLLRNDLGKVSRIGSVKVLHKRRFQKLTGVLHTYSKIESELKQGCSGIEALLSMFPGGSITGCPKKRAMEIIDEIEENSRGIYTGCIGYILPDQKMEFNIAIRTLVKRRNRLYLGVGGGITINSKMDDEYEETLAKAHSFFL